ncbi:MAG: hypothetical protein PVG67_11655 [Desulfobacterales bacterium]|jgi:hypothetical protein
MNTWTQLPSLDQALERLQEIENTFDEGARIVQTQQALLKNEHVAKNAAVVSGYYRSLADKGLFVPIYGAGDLPWALPLHMPPYLIEILWATARVMYALARQHLAAEGPDYLIKRMPDGWITDEMADILHRYYLTVEPDLAFDVLVYGANSERGMDFDEFKASGDHLYAKLLEAQSVDTYYGWLRECIRSARDTGAYDASVFTRVIKDHRPLSDAELDEQVLATYIHGSKHHRDRILFLEIDPRNQPSFQNLALLAKFISQGDPSQEPLILDPQNVFFDGDRLCYRWERQTGAIEKIISRLVDADFKAYLKNMTTQGKSEVIECLRQIYATPALWPDLSKHIAGFYLIDKSSITSLCMLEAVGVAPQTRRITSSLLESFRKNPSRLKQLAIKPLHGMSSKGVFVSPDLSVVEKYCSEEPMLAQELFWATPVMPNINAELTDPDALAGFCSETRLVFHAGSPAVPDSPNAARCILALSRTHYTSKDPARKIRNDAAGRGWFSNMGAILAVKTELGMTDKRAAGLGMAPICWLDTDPNKH